MQVFEFHFNPPLRQSSAGQAPNLVFDTFCFEPENFYEKKLGSLHLAGLLKNALPGNQRLLNNLANAIKEKYYKLSSQSPEKALRESLKNANGFLETTAKKGDVSWLGNLSFAALSLKDFKLNFTKVGEIKTLLLRQGQIIDVDKKLKFQDIEPYPLKIFPNIISGKLAVDDLIVVLTKEVYNFFRSQDLLARIAQIAPFDPAKLNEIFQEKNETLKELSGIFLLVYLSKENLAGEKRLLRAPQPKFSYRKFLGSILGRWPKINFPKVQSIGPLKLKRPKKIILILILLLVLVLGFFISRKQNQEKTASRKIILSGAQAKFDRAESLLTLKDNLVFQKEAVSLLKESWQDIFPLLKLSQTLDGDLKKELLLLKDKVFGELASINKLNDTEPELFFEADQKIIFPQKIALAGDDLYLFNQFSEDLLKVAADKKSAVITLGKKFQLVEAINDSIFLFSRPNEFVIIKGEEKFSGSLPGIGGDFQAEQMSSFGSNLYFLDRNSGQIIKYPYLSDLSWDSPFVWKRKTVPTPDVGTESLAVDGSVWVLNKDNTISRFYAGRLQEVLTPDIFPESQDFSKILIKPGLPYLYLLEPSQKRIVILTKQGEIFLQFQSEKFDNLLDFAVSADGKTIYLLNGSKIYKVISTPL